MRLEEEVLLKNSENNPQPPGENSNLKIFSQLFACQKRFNRKNPNKKLEEKILKIRSINKDWGYQRVYGTLRKLGMLINKKKVQRIMQNLNLQITSFTRKSRKYSSYKDKVGRLFLIEFIDVLIHKFPIRKLQQILLSLSIVRSITMDE